jgi:xanthine dehydrogenase YagR molybdenum-binding subunit
MAYIGSSTPRIDGRAKVTGTAKYAAEFDAPDLAHGFTVISTIAKGRIAHIDTAEAKAVPGVIDVLTHQHRPPMPDNDEAYKDDVAPEEGSPFRPLYDGDIKFAGQPVALVVAEDSETARFAASLVRVDYEEEAHLTDIRTARAGAAPTKDAPRTRGDAAGAFAAAAVKHEADYSTPIESHNPMELFASTVVRDADGRLTVYDKTQGVQNVQRYLCGVFGLESDQVRVVSPFVGGAFGLALRPQFQVVLAVMAARFLQRSVRVVLTRQQMYALGHRPAMIQRIQLGARTDGGLDAITHDAVTDSSRYEDFHRHDTIWSTNAPMPVTGTASPGWTFRPPATCARPVPSPASTRSRPPWTSSRSPSTWILWRCACAAIPGATRTPASHTAARRCASATSRPPRRSAGAGARRNPVPCATAPSWSDGAWRRACGRRCRYRSRSASR